MKKVRTSEDRPFNRLTNYWGLVFIHICIFVGQNGINFLYIYFLRSNVGATRILLGCILMLRMRRLSRYVAKWICLIMAAILKLSPKIIDRNTDVET